MSNDRIKKRLNKQTSKESVNTDAFMKINLESKDKLLPTGEVNRIVDVSKRFNHERQSSPYYRIIGTIRPVISNPLFNIKELYSWETLASPDFRERTDNAVLSDKDDLTYNESIKTHLKEIDGWFGYYDPDITKSGFCNYFDMEPKRRRFSFTPDIQNGDKKNWDLTITYPFSSDTKQFIVDGGLFICDKQTITVGGRTMIALGTPVLHNLEGGDTVRVTGTDKDTDYTVIKLGLDNGDLKGYYFAIDVSSIQIGNNSRMKRVYGGQESEYYFRLFKKIKTRNNAEIGSKDYEVYNLAFSQNIFNDPINQVAFNDDIDISDLVDNLNRPLSELYLTIIKTDSSQNTFTFSSVKSGIETPFIPALNNNTTLPYLSNIPVISRIHNGVTAPFNTHTPLETGVNINDDYFYGDVVEYNKYQVKETVLGEVHHRFNTTNRESNHSPAIAGLSTTILSLGPRQEGYYYKAHHLIRIREFSSYVEQGDITTDIFPNYAQDLGDGRYLWRDLLDIGFNDAKEELLDYPFLNGCHYIHDNFCFGLKRQDPFAHWGLYYNKFPADPIGDTINDKFEINNNNDVC